MGVTVLVLIGDVEVRFHPAPETEQTQLKIYCGSRALDLARERACSSASTRTNSTRASRTAS